MEKTRLEFLLETVAHEPDNTFARYGLAMELARSDRPEAAWEHFESLLMRHPKYTPTYYQASAYLLSRGRRDEAREVVRKGIEVTGAQGNAHAQSELERLLGEIEAPS